MLRLDNNWWIYSVGLINLPMYAMEVKYVVCKNLKMIIGDFGPVENELIFTLIFIVSGIWGAEKYEMSFGNYFNLSEASLLYDY
jgi:hypothetical protein